MNIFLSLDGVLSSESGEPNRVGVVIYYSLNANHRVALGTSRKKADAEHWLHSHGIIGYDDLLDSSYHLEGEDLLKRQITLHRSKAPIELYVGADPEMVAWAFDQGIPSIMVAVPSYLSINSRPDAPKAIRKWDEIAQSVSRQNIARSLDRTLYGDTELTNWE